MSNCKSGFIIFILTAIHKKIHIADGEFDSERPNAYYHRSVVAATLLQYSIESKFYS